jgi:proteasome lid subunit RPN8/RPN11
MPAHLCTSLVEEAQRLHAGGLKAFGLLLGDPADPRYPFRVVDVVVFDPQQNRRNEPPYRGAFRAQGSYFRRYEDAGFVADSTELRTVWRAAEERGLEPVAPFHIHRRQPANFSTIDYRLHNPAFAWHLIISLREPLPVIRPFGVRKNWAEFGIDEGDDLEGSELAYEGPEVTPLRLVTPDLAAPLAS